jgi:DNA-binding transcriptional regulator YhcF (GntR family)
VAVAETLEEKANRLYAYIHQYLIENAKAPSHKEMAKDLSISTETLAKCLNLLEMQGRAIHRIRGRARQVWVPIRKEE